jgi:hypothetical protein
LNSDLRVYADCFRAPQAKGQIGRCFRCRRGERKHAIALADFHVVRLHVLKRSVPCSRTRFLGKLRTQEGRRCQRDTIRYPFSTTPPSCPSAAAGLGQTCFDLICVYSHFHDCCLGMLVLITLPFVPPRLQARRAHLTSSSSPAWLPQPTLGAAAQVQHPVLQRSVVASLAAAAPRGQGGQIAALCSFQNVRKSYARPPRSKPQGPNAAFRLGPKSGSKTATVNATGLRRAGMTQTWPEKTPGRP